MEKRLDGNGPKALRRRESKKNSKSGIKVVHLVFIVGFILLISIINTMEPNRASNNISKGTINITLNNAVTDVGNQIIKPLQGNMFLHVELNLENKLNNLSGIDINNFIITDSSGIKYKATYYNSQNQMMTINIGSKNNIVSILSFEIPLSYKGELHLSYLGSKSHIQNIRSFVIQ